MKKSMKKYPHRLVLFVISGLLIASLLSGCFGAGASAVVYNWPGLTIDEVNQTGYVAHGNHIYAVDLNTGNQKWRFPSEAVKNLGFSAPPAQSSDGNLIVSSYDKSVHKINTETVQDVWVNQDAQNRYYAGPVIQEQVAYVSNTDNYLYAIDENNGVLKWKFETGDAIWSRPFHDGKTLFQTSMDHHVYAINPQTGALIWKSDDLGGAIAGEIVHNSNGELFVGSLANEVVALSQETGAILRRAQSSGWVFSAPAYQDGLLYFGDLNGTVYAIDASTFTEKWKIQPDTGNNREISGTPLVKNGLLYFANKGGFMFALDITNGAVQWSKQVTEDKIYAPLQSIGDTLLITPTGNGPLLIALDLNGNQKWAFSPAK